MIGEARLVVRYYGIDTTPIASSDTPVRRDIHGQGYTLGSAAYIGGNFRSSPFLRSISVPEHLQQNAPAGVDPFSPLRGMLGDTSSSLSNSSAVRVNYELKPPSAPITPVFMKRSSAPVGTRYTGNDSLASPFAASTGYDAPPHLVALERRMSEPGALQGIFNKMDISARARNGQGLGGHWNPLDRQAIPEENRVFPERILSGLSTS